MCACVCVFLFKPGLYTGLFSIIMIKSNPALYVSNTERYHQQTNDRHKDKGSKWAQCRSVYVDLKYPWPWIVCFTKNIKNKNKK